MPMVQGATRIGVHPFSLSTVNGRPRRSAPLRLVRRGTTYGRRLPPAPARGHGRGGGRALDGGALVGLLEQAEAPQSSRLVPLRHDRTRSERFSSPRGAGWGSTGRGGPGQHAVRIAGRRPTTAGRVDQLHVSAIKGVPHDVAASGGATAGTRAGISSGLCRARNVPMSAVNGPGRLVADMGPQCAYFLEFRSNACGRVGPGPYRRGDRGTLGDVAARRGLLADVGGPDAPADGRRIRSRPGRRAGRPAGRGLESSHRDHLERRRLDTPGGAAGHRPQARTHRAVRHQPDHLRPTHPWAQAAPVPAAVP